MTAFVLDTDIKSNLKRWNPSVKNLHKEKGVGRVIK